MTECDALRTAKATEKEIESGHDEHSLRGEGSPRTDPEKTAWLESVCGKRADGSEFIFFCCCRHNFGAGSGNEEGKAKTWVVVANTGVAAPHKHYTYLSPRA